MKLAGAAIIAAAVAVSAAESAERYLWPLETERKLSSSFAEYRDGHYHAGIDLRTFGRVGLPCRAIDDCEAVRLRVQPAGYGKALYLRTRDGRVAVYAHLDGFCRSLDSLAYHWRLERGRNSCDIDLPPGRFVFERGDIVAYTGTSGSLHPHLHFEMRSGEGAPVNPLETFFAVPDACPPILTALAVVPRRWGSLVDGSPLALTRRFRLAADSRYAVADTFELDGEFGFGVRAYDQQTRGSYRMGWYDTELLIDGEPAYRARNSSFDYSRYNDVDIEYEEHDGESPGRYLALFKKSASGMGGREGGGAVTNIGPRDGVRLLAPGVHRGDIVVRDAAGNAARGAFHFRVREFGEGIAAESPDPTASAGDSVSFEFLHEIRAEGLYVRMRTAPPLAAPPELMLLGDTTRSPIEVLPLGGGEYVALVPPRRFLGGARTLRARAAEGSRPAFERFATPRILSFETGSRDSFVARGDMTVRLLARSVRGAAVALVADASGASPPGAGLALLAGPFTLEYAPEAFGAYPLCSFEAERRAGLYRREAKGTWRYAGVPDERGAVDVRRPGAYAIMIDADPPELRAKAITRAGPPSGYFKRRLLCVSVREEGSGVDAESVAAFIDGRRVVCEYDSYRGRLMVPLPRSHPRGAARLRVEVADHAGNSGSAEYSVVIE